MQGRIEESSVRTKMEELRLVCMREIPIRQHRMDNDVASFRKYLESTKARCLETANNRERIGKLKVELREVEDDLVKALAAKTRKESERMATMDSISGARARIEELKRIVEDQKARKSDYAEIISKQYEALSACEKNCIKNKRDLRDIEEAMSWYNRFLGFRIECGHGVKFIFMNIDPSNPNLEYSFSIRHENDLYTLLECDPHVDTEEAMLELNKSNGLFKFVRTVREKFQKAAAHGKVPQLSSQDEVTSTVCVSAPDSSVSTESRSESVLSLSKLQPEETKRTPKKVNRGTAGKASILSPGFASSLRRSQRFKVKK